jgi:hypothetical protein
MKRIFCIACIAFSLAFASCSNDIFDNIKEHASDEKVYVGKFDKADVLVGINRLEIDLMNAGRIPADKVNIGKAVQTIVEYDGKTHPCEGVQSWLNITGLTESKLYRIKVYNVDELGNKSIPVEVAAIPFTDADVAALAVPVPQKFQAPASLQLGWSSGLTSNFMDFHEMDYSYTDAQGKLHKVKSTDNNSITMLNLAEGSAGRVDMRLKVVPKQNNTAILDTVYLESTIEYRLPTVEQYLDSRIARKVKNPYIEGNRATVSWGDSTEHLVLSELMYETVSGTFNTVRVKAGGTTVECPNAKPGVLYKTRSGFLPPGSVDTLYKDWTVSKYPFLTFPTGSFRVDPLSYRYSSDTGEPSSPVPQAEYAADRSVTIEAVEEGRYKISDMIGGFYNPGRYDGNEFLCGAVFDYVDGPVWPLIEISSSFYWSDPWIKLEGNWDADTRTMTLDAYWSSGNLVFHVILHK